MSSRALLKGFEARLRSILSDAQGRKSGVQPPPGRPPAFSGQRYYAVWFTGASGADPNALSDDTEYGVCLTITARMGNVPRDRQGEQMTLADELLDEADQFKTAFHQDDLTRVEANKLIPGTEEYCAIHGGSATANGFEEPLRFQQYDAPQEQGEDWLKTATAGGVWSINVYFGGAKRVTPIGG